MAFQSRYPRLSGESHLTCFGSTLLGALLVGVSLFLCPGCGLVIVLLLGCRVVDLLGFSFLLVSFCARDVGVFCSLLAWFAMVWFWPVPGMWAVVGSLFFLVLLCFRVPGCGLRLILIVYQVDSCSGCRPFPLFLGEVLPVFLLGWVALPP